jgi:hypothetical protein
LTCCKQWRQRRDLSASRQPGQSIEPIQLRQVQELAAVSQLKLETFNANNPRKVEASTVWLERRGLDVLSDVFFMTDTRQLAALSLRHRISTLPFAGLAIARGPPGYATDFV